MQTRPQIGPRRIAMTAAAALAFAAVSATSAMATVVNDPDEPAVAADLDLEWAGASRAFVQGTGWLHTHTIKTRAPYSARPCLRIRVAGTTTYSVCNTRMYPGGSASPVAMRESPAAAPDTVSYTFNATQIGSPSTYEWLATAGHRPIADFAPDTGWSVFDPRTITTRQPPLLASSSPEMPWTEPDPREDNPRPGPDNPPW